MRARPWRLGRGAFYRTAVFIVLAAVLGGFVWGMLHGQVWLPLNVRGMAKAARSLHSVHKHPHHRLEAARPTSFRAPQKFLATLFGTIVTGGMLAVLATTWSFLVPYPVGLFAGFSPAFILAEGRVSARAGGVLCVGATGMLLYDDAGGPGEDIRMSETTGERETPDQEGRPAPAWLPSG